MTKMLIDERPSHYQGDLSWDSLKQLIEGYDDNEFQGLVQGPVGYAIKVVRGAHSGSFYPYYGSSYYFDFTATHALGESDIHHAILDSSGTRVLGIEPPL
ncbi:hypothetical protein [Sorangium sp. So ce145]|uniref:hypothetical protein n=1 Tax=Sorangium sp. So ce145 TaxID=3133285 RepID=UPI003F5D88E5